MPGVQRRADQIIVDAEQYRLTLDPNDGTWAELARENAPVARLFLPGAVDTVEGRDVTLSVSPPTLKERGDNLVFTIHSQSSLWQSRVTKLRCRDEALDLDIRIEGDDLIEDVRFFGGATPAGPIRSIPRFNKMFSPAPNAHLKQHFDPDNLAYISVRDHPEWHDGAWFFTPAPLCFGLRAAQANWMGAVICAKPGQHTFEDYVYDGRDGFEFRLTYATHTATHGEWTSPRLALVGGADEYDALQSACTWRLLCGGTPQHNAPSALWWRSPIFSGWGEQLLQAQANGVQPAAHSTQANYDRWVAYLAKHNLNPGIIIVEDKWQEQYGDPRPDPAKWPDMRDFIRRQHDEGRHVVLWWKAWDPEGLPAEERILNSPWPEGSVDPTSRIYRQRLRNAVEYLIGDLDADGFKIDYTHRTPYGRRASAQGDTWGLELLRNLVAHISDAAKDVKDDALIISQTPDPYFANVVDMIHLNNMPRLDGQHNNLGDVLTHMTHRARVARAASADWLIDTDNWPSLNREQWLGYIQRQPYLGIPALYYVTHISRTGEPLRPEDYAAVAQTWKSYLSRKTR